MASIASLRVLRQAHSLTNAIRKPNLVAALTVRSFSSNESRPSPARLRRPFRLQQQPAAEASSNGGLSRKHTVTLFPGDFSGDNTADDFDDDDDIFNSKDDSQDEADLMIQDLERRQAQEKANRERWIRNSVPPVRVSEIDDRGRAYGRGGRKAATARVWVQPGLGEVVVNGRDFVEYFDRQSDRELVLAPLVATDTCGAFDVQVMVRGGGLTGQAGAVRHGLANALNKYNPDAYRPYLKSLGLLERDARKVERKKIGHVKARKSPQWVRR